MKPSCPICSSLDKKFIYKSWQDIAYSKCFSCGVVFQDPFLNHKYDEGYWKNTSDPEGNKRDLTLERNNKIKNWHKDALDFINGLNLGRILDVGSGLGFFLSAVNEKWDRHGIECSEFAVDFARKNFKGIEFFVSSVEDYKGIEDFYDVVHMYHVIEHLDNPEEAIKKANRILKREGFLILGTPNIESFCARRFKGNFRLLDRGHKVLFPLETITRIIKDAGFSVEKITFPYFKTSYFNVKSILRLLDTSKLSPPFWGNIMDIYAKKI